MAVPATHDKTTAYISLPPGAKLVIIKYYKSNDSGLVYAITVAEPVVPLQPVPVPINNRFDLGRITQFFTNIPQAAHDAFWLGLKLGFVLFLFAHNGSWFKTIIFYSFAFAIMVVQLKLIRLPDWNVELFPRRRGNVIVAPGIGDQRQGNRDAANNGEVVNGVPRADNEIDYRAGAEIQDQGMYSPLVHLY